ncbi:MAG TPA: VWA domain-containing protein [Terriglobales bacterium]|nr:VWA domain-containing protein [Terriglobales bacterium]
MHLRNEVKPGLPNVQQVIAHGLSIIAVVIVSAAMAAQVLATPPSQPQSQSTTSAGQSAPAAPPSVSSQSASTPAQAPDSASQQGDTVQVTNNGGESPQREDNGVYVFKAQVEEVQLHATVVDDKHRFVTDLTKNDFSVFEDGKPQTISSFRREDVPVSLGIVIDNSGSMRDKRPAVNQAAINLVKASNPQDQVFIVNFNDEYYLDQDFTSNIAKLRDGLEKIESRGGTALYDAIMASADHLKKNSRLEKKVLLVVTDGEDNASRNSLERAIRFLQAENGPTVYTIGLLGDEHTKRARRALEEIAEDTGGIGFFPKDLKEVDAISNEVAHDIRNQYTIGYKPTTPRSAGGYRTVKVEAKAPHHGKLFVRTRSGYYAGQEQASNQ